MAPKIKAACAACVDPRIQKIVREFLEENGLPEGAYANHRIPRATFDLETLIAHLEVSIGALGARRVFLFEHEICFIYEMAREEKRRRHIEKLQEAKSRLGRIYPEVEFRLIFLRRITDEEWKVEE